MSSRRKLVKFADIAEWPNVYENLMRPDKLLSHQGKYKYMRGQWKTHFNNDHPITLELACGKGEYSCGLGKRYPHRNFIGVDVKGNRIWKGAGIAQKENLINVAFLRTWIQYLDLFFAKAEVEEIWITFPDPFLKKR